MEETIKILILEDSETDAALVEYLLLKEKMKCEFLVANNRESYQAALDEFQPDIILSDHSIPQFDSTEALSLARMQYPGIPFIMVTGTASEEFAVGIIQLGADDYILKDRMTRLPAAINKTLQKRKSEKEKQETEKKIIQSETHLRTIFENTSEGFLLLDRDAVIMAFNSNASRYTYLSGSTDFQIGRSVYDFIEDSRKEFAKEIISKVLTGENMQYERSYEYEDGRTTWIEFSATPVIERVQVKGICITGRNITEKKMMEQAIINQKIEEQKTVARAIIQAQEKERNHIGRELHDNINQILATAKMLLSVACKRNEDTKQLIKYPLELIENSIEEIRILCHELVTTVKDIDLQIMIRNLLNNFSQHTAIRTKFTYLESYNTISDDLKLNIYRIMQEQLNNILKHASAQKVTVSVQVDKAGIIVSVADDGIGFNVNEKSKGIGISNMKNRVESYNGKVDIISSPGDGSTLHIVVPC
jgi:two-component system sensor histidine kinase UhpB